MVSFCSASARLSLPLSLDPLSLNPSVSRPLSLSPISRPAKLAPGFSFQQGSLFSAYSAGLFTTTYLRKWLLQSDSPSECLSGTFRAPALIVMTGDAPKLQHFLPSRREKWLCPYITSRWYCNPNGAPLTHSIRDLPLTVRAPSIC